jgi:hypothetical protein
VPQVDVRVWTAGAVVELRSIEEVRRWRGDRRREVGWCGSGSPP